VAPPPFAQVAPALRRLPREPNLPDSNFATRPGGPVLLDSIVSGIARREFHPARITRIDFFGPPIAMRSAGVHATEGAGHDRDQGSIPRR
jgi:hypothetical protein